MYTALLKVQSENLCDYYNVRKIDDAGDVNESQLESMIVVPHGSTVKDYMEKTFEGRCTGNFSYGDKSDWCNVYVWKHRLATGKSLAELGLMTNAFGTVLIDYPTDDDLKEELAGSGLGEFQPGKKLSALCNGMVFERVPGNHVMFKVSMDPKRAKRIIASRRKLAQGATKSKSRPPQLSMTAIYIFGVRLRDNVWERMGLDHIRRACIGGYSWIGFRSSGWDQTLWSVDHMFDFYKKNRISLEQPVRAFLANKGERYKLTVPVSMLPKLIARKIAAFKSKSAKWKAKNKDNEGDPYKDYINTLTRIFNLVSKYAPKEKKGKK